MHRSLQVLEFGVGKEFEKEAFARYKLLTPPRNYFSCFTGDTQLVRPRKDLIRSVEENVRKKLLLIIKKRKRNPLFDLFASFTTPTPRPFLPFVSRPFLPTAFRFLLPFPCQLDGEIHSLNNADHQPVLLLKHHHLRSRHSPRYHPNQHRIYRYNARTPHSLPLNGTILRRSILHDQQ